MDQYAQLYIQEIVRLYSMSMFIVSYRDFIFISRYGKSFYKTQETKLVFSIAFHPQIDNQ